MIQKVLFLNICSVNTQTAFHRVQMLHRHHKFFLICLDGAIVAHSQIQRFEWRLGMHYVNCNANGQIWVLLIHWFK